MSSISSKFCQALQRTISEYRPQRVIETGTYLGTGSTLAIIRGIHDSVFGQERDLDYKPTFVTIEIDASRIETAIKNVGAAGFHPSEHIQFRHGLSIPRSLLPNAENECRMAMRHGIPVDMPLTGQPWDFYNQEVGFSGPEDVLGNVLAKWGGDVDMVLLDSAGHMGYAEFKYLMSIVNGPFVLCLDDIKHVKHWRSLQAIKEDSRFRILELNESERNGHVVAQFTAS